MFYCNYDGHTSSLMQIHQPNGVQGATPHFSLNHFFTFTFLATIAKWVLVFIEWAFLSHTLLCIIFVNRFLCVSVDDAE